MRLSYREFLRRLEQTPRTWMLEHGRIRSTEAPQGMISTRCPANIVHGREVIMTNDHRVFIERCNEIVAAADGDALLGPYNPQVRKDLLAACGLEEQP